MLFLNIAVAVLVWWTHLIAAADDHSNSSGRSQHTDRRKKFLFGDYRTTTETAVSYTTSTVFPYCLDGVVTTLCPTRKKKRSYIERDEIEK